MESNPTSAVTIAMIASVSSIAGALLALIGNLIVARINARSEKRRVEKEIAADLDKSRIDADINIAKIADARIKSAFEHQQKQIDGLVELNDEKSKRIEEDERQQRINVEKIDELTHHSRTCEKVLKQTERQLRYYDETLGIIRWEANDAGGLVYVNKNFLRCTGLTESEAIEGDGLAWLRQVSDSKRTEVEERWRELTKGEINEFSLSFVFQNKRTQDLTAVTVDVESMFGLGDEVYKFIARTKPLYLINAELVLENKRLEDENRELIGRNLKLIGYVQEGETHGDKSSLNRFIHDLAEVEKDENSGNDPTSN